MKNMLISVVISCLSFGISAQTPDELLDIAYQYELQQPDTAILLYQKAFKQYKKAQNWEGAGRALSYCGIVSSDQGWFDKALAFYDSSDVYWQKTNFVKGLASNQNNRANIFLYKDFYKASSACFFKAASLFESINDSVNAAIAYTNQGNIYVRLNEYEKALNLYRNVLSVLAQQQDTLTKAYAFIDYAAIYYKLDEHDSVKTYLKLAEPLVIDANNPFLSFFYLRNLSYYQLKQEQNYEAALTSAMQMLELTKVTGRAIDEVQARVQLGHSYLVLNKVRLSKINLEKAISVAKENGFLSELVEAYQLLALTYEKAGNYQEANKANKLLLSYSDSLLNINKHRQVQELNYLYETERKDRELAQASLNIKNQQLTIQKTRVFAISFVGIILLLIVLVIFQVNRMRLKRKLFTQQLSLIEKEEELKIKLAKEEAEEDERKRIANELHDGIVGQVAGMKFSVQGIFKQHNINDDNASELLNAFGSLSNEVRTISHKLGNTLIKKQGLKNAIASYLKPLATNLTIDFQFSEKAQCDEKTEHEMYRIVQELVNNVVKHAKATRLVVNVCVGNPWEILVTDNGQGLQEADGFGLKSVKQRVEKINGDIVIEANEANGTTIVVKQQT